MTGTPTIPTVRWMFWTALSSWVAAAVRVDRGAREPTSARQYAATFPKAGKPLGHSTAFVAIDVRPSVPCTSQTDSLARPRLRSRNDRALSLILIGPVRHGCRRRRSGLPLPS
jgi:hypothetical protein